MLQRQLLEDAMRRALNLAARGPEHDENPRVGCVILDSDGRIVAEGWHRGAGTQHAETDALAQLSVEWTQRRNELTAVITLEPCNHTGRTGPCAKALAESGLRAVAFAVEDRGILSQGGADVLRAAGVQVEGGILAAEGEQLLASWRTDHARHATNSSANRAANDGSGGRPRIIAKWAQTLDGRAAAADGTSQWITGVDARTDVHVRRAAADAILIGTGTLLADDPSLTARTPAGDLLVPPAEQPIPIVIGSRAIPAHARITSHPALAAAGLDTPITLRGENLIEELGGLTRNGINSVFIEGGPRTISAFLREGLVDECLVYTAPALLGGPGLAIDEIGVTTMAGILRFTSVTCETLGNDLLIHGFTPHVAEPSGPAQKAGIPAS